MAANTAYSNEEHHGDTPSDIQPLHFQSQSGIQDVRNGGHGTVHTYPQDETQLPGGVPDTAGNLHPVIFTAAKGVGITEREAVEEQFRVLSHCIDEEQAKYKTEKADLERQLQDVNHKLKKCNEEMYTKDQQLSAMTEKLCSKDEQTREQLRSKDEQLLCKDDQLIAKDKQLHSKDEQLRCKDEQLCSKDNQLRGKDEQLRSKDDQLKVQNEQLSAKNNEFEQLKTQSDNLSKKIKHLESTHNHILEELEKQKKKLKKVEQLKELPKQLNDSVQRQLRTVVKQEEVLQLRVDINRLQGESAKDESTSCTSIPAQVQQSKEEIEIPAPKVRFWIKQVLGVGSFGKVYEGEIDDKPCAVKILNDVAQSLITGWPIGDSDEANLQKAKNTFKVEGDCLKRINHENIVKLYDIRVFPKGDYPVLVMEKMECSLTCYLKLDGKNIGRKEQLSFSCNIASALEYLRENGIVHRDLCSDNVLLDRKEPIPIAKVSDFGMSMILKDFIKMSSKLSVNGQRIACYPPEWLVNPKSCDKSIDIFMFGVVMTQIALRIPAIESIIERCDLISRLSENHVLKKFIMRCVKSEQNERPLPKELHTDLKERLHQKSEEN